MLQRFKELLDLTLKGTVQVAFGDGGLGSERSAPDLIGGACAFFVR